MAPRVEAFVIHLPRATMRRAQVDRIVAACPVPATVLDAIDGSTMSGTARSAVYREDGLFPPRYPFALGSGEIGCFLSHRRAWRAIVDRKLDAGLILEDDVEIDRPVFARTFGFAREMCAERSYVQFQVRPPVNTGRTTASRGGLRIVRPLVAPLRTSAQLVTRSAAGALLEATERFDRPIDAFLQMHWLTGVRIECAVPSGVSDRTTETGGSTISRRKTLGERIRREFMRWSYRRKIARRSAEPDAKTAV